jgi:ribosomal protein L11 methyltransferase
MEVVVSTAVGLADGVASELVESVEAAQQGVQVRKGDVVFWVHPDELDKNVALVRACLQGLQDAGWNVDPDRVRAGARAPEEEWRDAWKKHFHVTRLTRQIVVVPSWETYEPLAADVPIHLDPGQAFGTGAHASTQLVLEYMQEFADAGLPTPERVFDLGTGSGILAIVAAKLWPTSQIVATDIDPMSITATLENATQNGVQARIAVSTDPLGDVDGAFPLVLANLQAHILRELRDGLLPKLQPGASLLVSGILSSQIHALCEFYCEDRNLEVVDLRPSRLDADWSSAHLRRLS